MVGARIEVQRDLVSPLPDGWPAIRQRTERRDPLYVQLLHHSMQQLHF